MNSHRLSALLLFSVMLFSNLSANAQEPNPIAGVRQEKKTISVGEIPVGELTQYLRDGKKVLEKVTPTDPKLNTVFYIYLDGRKVFTYKIGILGTEFQAEGSARLSPTRPFSIKLAGDSQSRINKITLYTNDFAETLDGYWLKDNAIIPWSSKELANHRKQRD